MTQLKTKLKIAAVIATVAALFTLLAASSVYWVLSSQIENRVYSTLGGALDELAIGFQEDNLDSSNLSLNRSPVFMNREEVLPQLKEIESKIVEDASEGEEDKFAQLRNNREVHARVILADGGVLFSSDLFENNIVDTESQGARRDINAGVCIYSNTYQVQAGVDAGAIVQVAQYCPIPLAVQENINWIIPTMVLLILLSSLIPAYILAHLMVRPLQKQVEDTRRYVDEVHHELLTPLSVVRTTAESSLLTEQYKSGLKQVDQGLAEAIESLQLLQLLQNRKQLEGDSTDSLVTEEVDIKVEIESFFKTLAELHGRADMSLGIELDGGSLHHLHKTSFKLLLKNVIENALKFSTTNSKLTCKFTAKSAELVFSNPIATEASSKTAISTGLGLSICKRLAALNGWQFETFKTKVELREKFNVRIRL